MQFPLTARRRDAVRALLGNQATVVGEEPIGHLAAPVTRLTFDREVEGVGRTVVVKTRRVEGDGHGGPAYLRREEAALRAVAHLGVAPRLIAADQDVGVVVTADLGSWPTLEALLLGDDADAAAQALIAFGTTVGRLHAGTSSQVGVKLPWPGAERWQDVEAACANLGLPDARDAAGDAAFVAAQFAEPGPFGVLAHNDLNPGNAIVTPGGVRLVDFEGADHGHLGFDASFLHFPFPTYSAHWATLPPSVVRAADRAYRGELEGEGLDQAIVVGAAAALAVRVQRLQLLASGDQPAAIRWRRRAQLVQQIGVFTRLAAEAGALPRLAGWFERLAAAMAARWPDATDPAPAVFPAFQRR
ncbi:hypothetical protein ACQP00_25120 [Dactylosporangium sp. CS-047395]|uniref:hypothetical protein n=1 Tax=Dactylosporangium sp. CS-047395 TaxID=3239936 RepID=UPI003D92A2F7